MRAIQQRQEAAARQRADQAAAREAAEAVAQAEAESARLRARIRDLEQENSALHDEIAQLIEAGGQAGEVPYEWGLGRQEARLLLAIRHAGQSVLTVEAGLVALAGDAAESRHRNMVAVLIWRIRRKFADRAIAIVIETHERRGYRLSAASIALFDAALRGAPLKDTAS